MSYFSVILVRTEVILTNEAGSDKLGTAEPGSAFDYSIINNQMFASLWFSFEVILAAILKREQKEWLLCFPKPNPLKLDSFEFVSQIARNFQPDLLTVTIFWHPIANSYEISVIISTLLERSKT